MSFVSVLAVRNPISGPARSGEGAICVGKRNCTTDANGKKNQGNGGPWLRLAEFDVAAKLAIRGSEPKHS